jgi:hypothetical protein
MGKEREERRKKRKNNEWRRETNIVGQIDVG